MDGQAGAASVEMPRYRSHKEVWALQIDRLEPPKRGPDKPLDYIVHFVRSDTYAPKMVAPMVFARGEPEHGDYLVVYRDGYTSWSPRSEFEDGYTAI